MKLSSSNFEDGQVIPGNNAFCVADPENHVALAPNRNPALAWSGLPAGTRSLVLICHDPDVPTKPDDVNQEGRVVPADLPRCDFYHWVLVDIPATHGGLAEGAHSDGVTPGGKAGPDADGGMRHGLNNYTEWFAGDDDMAGQYFGYDGPCPPWNDSLVHHYVFTLYALDVERCPVEGTFGGDEVREAMAPHVLRQATLTGLYSLNPDVLV
ncbi:MAG: YbhB/YbcL family Raf kinase inhibitor-like protein [Xanthomonadales bacterium]|nr:YbhB/YbcL family Raf kinase inhibitor-like protein [Xanthomonadales bacterium]